MTVAELRILLLNYPQDATVTNVTRVGSKYDRVLLEAWDIEYEPTRTGYKAQEFVDIGEL